MFAVTIAVMSGVVTDLTKLIYCDGCGVVGVEHAPRWRTWTEPPPFKPLVDGFMARRHHCPLCADNNQLLAGGLIYGRDPAEAKVYEPA